MNRLTLRTVKQMIYNSSQCENTDKYDQGIICYHELALKLKEDLEKESILELKVSGRKLVYDSLMVTLPFLAWESKQDLQRMNKERALMDKLKKLEK